MLRYSYLLLTCLLCYYAQSSTYSFESGDKLERLDYTYLEYIVEEVDISLLSTAKFKKAEKIDFGQSKESLWVRFNVTNNSPNEEIYVMLPIAHIDSIRMFDSLEFGSYHSSLSGDLVKNSTKDIRDPYQIFKLNLKKGEKRMIYFRISSSSQIILPFTLANKDALDDHRSIRNIFLGAFVGVLLVMFFYNLIVFLYTRADSYTYYISYLISITTAQAGLTGVSTYIFGETPILNNSLLFVGSGFAGVFSILFIQSFLHVRAQLPKLNYALNVLIILYAGVVVTPFFGLYDLSFKLINICGGSIALVFAIISITLAKRGDRKAKFYFTAWIGLIISVIVFTLVLSGLIDFVPNTNFIIPIGVVLETVLLSLALADSINVLREEKESANQRVVEEVTKNEELVKNQNITLEQKVEVRTAELQKALDHLKETQSQLVESEKMASLGTLTAGIAHEINNPINFVSANVIPLRDNITDITNLIKEYKAINFRNLKAELARLTKLEEELDLDYMLKETKELVDGIEEGANRTQTIVAGLTTFSRGDAGLKVNADINKGIVSTLSVLKSRLNSIDLLLYLDKDLPQLTCDIGKINQVVLNLLNNALDALEEKNGANSPKSELLVKSWSAENAVKIQVEDNAGGIDAETQRKVMEPFYTTKPVGKGTGLGLSISYSIIKDHGGTVDLLSEEGEGTSFIITLPIEPALG